MKFINKSWAIFCEASVSFRKRMETELAQFLWSFEEWSCCRRRSCGSVDRMARHRCLRRTALEVLVLLVLELYAVSSDLTDGNTEHLKRDHSLTKPYHGELPRLAALASLPADAARWCVRQTMTEIILLGGNNEEMSSWIKPSLKRETKVFCNCWLCTVSR